MAFPCLEKEFKAKDTRKQQKEASVKCPEESFLNVSFLFEVCVGGFMHTRYIAKILPCTFVQQK